MINIRKLAAVDLAWLGAKVIKGPMKDAVAAEPGGRRKFPRGAGRE